MFTGIIEELGIIKKIEHKSNVVTLTIYANKILDGTHLGDSISTNGVCLTVTNIGKETFNVDMVKETLHRTTMKTLKIGAIVNLERALTLSTRLGGHMVSGHIDGTGVIERITNEGQTLNLTIKTDPHLLKYMIEKGSVALDGISLTIVEVTAHTFTVSIIPHTQSMTTLTQKKVHDTINIECDLIGKYVEKLLGHKEKAPLSADDLIKMGY